MNSARIINHSGADSSRVRRALCRAKQVLVIAAAGSAIALLWLVISDTPCATRYSRPHLLPGNAPRDSRCDTQLIIQEISVQPGEVIADVGAGLGYFTFKLSPLAGPAGRVIATEANIVRAFFIGRHRDEGGYGNVSVEWVWSSDVGIGIPIDKALLVNVFTFRDVEWTSQWFSALRDVMKPSGRAYVYQDKYGSVGSGVLSAEQMLSAVTASFSLEKLIPLRHGCRQQDEAESGGAGYFIILKKI